MNALLGLRYLRSVPSLGVLAYEYPIAPFRGIARIEDSFAQLIPRKRSFSCGAAQGIMRVRPQESLQKAGFYWAAE